MMEMCLEMEKMMKMCSDDGDVFGDENDGDVFRNDGDVFSFAIEAHFINKININKLGNVKSNYRDMKEIIGTFFYL